MSIFTQAARIAASVLAESYRHRFCFRRSTWIVALASVVLLAAVLLALEAPWRSLLLPALLLVATLVALVARERATRGSPMPVLALVSRFKPSTKDAEGASVNHRLAMIDEITGDHGLQPLVEARPLERLSRQQAETLLEECPARAAIYGEIRVAADDYLVDGGICFDLSISPASAVEREGSDPPERHVPIGDPGRPLRELVGERSAVHFAVVRAELLKLAVMLDA